MKNHILKTLFMLMVVTMTETLALDLDSYKWQNRIVIIFSNEKTDDFIKSVEPLSTLSAEILDRDLKVIRIVNNGKSYIDDEELYQQQVAPLVDKYKPNDNENVTILIGKDGGEKYRHLGVTDWQEIFRRIDAMPMRQAEMRQNVKDKK
jgi:biopolymer transport protein ExbD